MTKLTERDWQSPAGQLLAKLYGACKTTALPDGAWGSDQVTALVIGALRGAGVDFARGVDQFPAAASGPAIVDQAFERKSRQVYRFTRTYREETGQTVRITVHRDDYVQQSYAYADVFTPALTWTRLAEESPHVWAEETPSPYATRQLGDMTTVPMGLLALTDRLHLRARVVLGLAG